MNADRLIRTGHRWVSIAFTAGVVTYIVAMSGGTTPPAWMGLLALVPLIVLLFSGLYLFALPYVLTWRNGRRPAREA